MRLDYNCGVISVNSVSSSSALPLSPFCRAANTPTTQASMSAENDAPPEDVTGAIPAAAPEAAAPAAPAAAPAATPSSGVDSGLTVTRRDIEEAAGNAMSSDTSQLTRSSLGSTGNKDSEGKVDLTDTIVASFTKDNEGEDERDDDVAKESHSPEPPANEPSRHVPWPQNPLEYMVGAKIGQGAFAEVRHALRKSDQKPCAIKIIKLENLGESDNAQLQDEIIMMLSMKHPNVLSCHAVFQTRRNHVDELWVIMPYMDLGSALRVLTILKNNGSGEGCGESASKALMAATLRGLEYLHNQGIVHRDIKSGNILLDSSGAVCIADFGVSSWLRDKRTGVRDHCSGQAQTFVGTPCWMAPEVMEQNGGYNTSADVWSFGITALELAKGCAPYYGLTPMKVSSSTFAQCFFFLDLGTHLCFRNTLILPPPLPPSQTPFHVQCVLFTSKGCCQDVTRRSTVVKVVSRYTLGSDRLGSSLQFFQEGNWRLHQT